MTALWAKIVADPENVSGNSFLKFYMFLSWGWGYLLNIHLLRKLSGYAPVVGQMNQSESLEFLQKSLKNYWTRPFQNQFSSSYIHVCYLLKSWRLWRERLPSWSIVIVLFNSRAPRSGSGPNCPLEGPSHPPIGTGVPSSHGPSIPTLSLPLLPTWCGARGPRAQRGGEGGPPKRHLGPDPHQGVLYQCSAGCDEQEKLEGSSMIGHIWRSAHALHGYLWENVWTQSCFLSSIKNPLAVQFLHATHTKSFPRVLPSTMCKLGAL